jgi:hypothetical protein
MKFIIIIKNYLQNNKPLKVKIDNICTYLENLHVK